MATTVPKVINIKDAEIKKAFAAYGYNPSAADLQYWSLKPNTDLTSLYDKLEARKTKQEEAINKQVSEGAQGEAIFEDQSKGAIVKFATDPDGSGPLSTSTLFWVNPTSKKIVPIVSAEAYESFFDTPLTSANVKTITADYLRSDGVLGSNAGYSMVPLSQGINGSVNDETYKVGVDSVNEDALGTRYGKSALSTDQLTKVLKGTDGLFDVISNDSKSGISADLISQIKNDPTQVAFYMNALAYGGYTLADVTRDLKRKQLIKNGDTSLSSTVVISPNQTATDYFKTTAGSAAKTNPAISAPAYLGDLDTSLLNYPIFNLPDSVFNTLSPVFDPNSEEGKAEMEKVSTAFYDVVQQQLNASTEREKAIADQNYSDFVKNTKEKYGIYLSNNATTAWNQLQNISNNASAAGLSGSGIERESIDKQLQQTRKNDMLSRTEQQTAEDAKRAEQLQKYGSASEIASLTDEEKVKYGFKPSAETSAYFSAENLRKLFPTLTDDQIKTYQNSILDENGNYRSDLYQTLYQKTYGTSAGLSVPESGVQTAKKDYQQTTAAANAALAEEKAYAPYTAQDPFSKPNDTSTINPVTPTPAPTTIDPSNTDYWESNPNKKTLPPTSAPITPIVPSTTPGSAATAIKNSLTSLVRSTPLKTNTQPNLTKIRVPNAAALGKYKEADLVRDGSNVYLKEGVKQLW